MDIELALSNVDVEDIVGKQINMIVYDNLNTVGDINDLFINNCCLISYRWGDNMGHWCCLRKNKKGNKTIISFFDSYGDFPDDELKKIKLKFNPEIARLLLKFRDESDNNLVEYNDEQLQKKQFKVNTCGRWCGLFMKYKDVSADDFADIFLKYKKYIDLDELVTELTQKFIYKNYI